MPGILGSKDLLESVLFIVRHQAQMRRVDGFTKEKAWSCTDRPWCDNQYFGSQSVRLLGQCTYLQ